MLETFLGDFATVQKKIDLDAYLSLLELKSTRNLQDWLQAPWVAFINLAIIKSPAEGIWKDFLKHQVHFLLHDWREEKCDLPIKISCKNTTYK